MKMLYGLFPKSIYGYAFVFCLRFDLLVYRAGLIWISDSLQLAQYFAKLDDPSNEVHRLARILRDNAITEALRYVARFEQSIASASTAPALEVELRLVQIMIKKIVEGALLESPENSELKKIVRIAQEKTGLNDPDVVIRELNRGVRHWNEVPQVENGLDLSPSFTKEQSETSLKTAIALCKEYPSTAGRFLSIATALRAYEVGSGPTNLPRMYTVATRLVEKTWGSHRLGQLQTCQKGHPYSGGSFPEGCPECGSKAELPDMEFARNARFLHEDKFLEQMRIC
jgi:rRNA maturation protein Nop10